MNRLYHSFDAGVASGTTVSAANSATGGVAFDSVTIGASATLTYVSGTGARGALCLRYTTPTTATTSFGLWSTAFGTATRVYGRATVTPFAVPNQSSIIRVRNGSTQLFRVSVDQTGAFALRNGANTAVATSTNLIAVNGSQTWRVAWDVTIGTSATGVLHIYTDPTSNVPTETLTATSANFGTGPATEAAIGQVASLADVDIRLDDVLITDEALPGPPSQSRSVAEAITFSEAVARTGLALTRAVAESVGLVAAVGRVSVISRSAAETVTVADASAATTSRAQAAADTVTVAGAPAGTTSRDRVVAESVALAGLVAATTSGARAVADAVTVADQGSHSANSGTRVVAEAVGMTESLTRTGAGAVSVTETVTLTAQASQGSSSRARVTADAVHLVDVAARVGAAFRSGAGAVQLTGTVGRLVVLARSVAESVALGNAASSLRLLRPVRGRVRWLTPGGPARVRSTTANVRADTTTAGVRTL